MEAVLNALMLGVSLQAFLLYAKSFQTLYVHKFQIDLKQKINSNMQHLPQTTNKLFTIIELFVKIWEVLWKGVWVVERAALEMRWSSNVSAGSNPVPSARLEESQIFAYMFANIL